MSTFRITLLAFVLGLPAAASADESAWGTLSSRSGPLPAAQLGRPVIAQTPAPSHCPPPADGGGSGWGAGAPAQLERPRALNFTAPFSDSQVQPASFAPVFRAEAPDAKPLPSGPPPSTDAPVVSQNWQRTTPDQIVSAPPGVVGPGPGAASADCCGSCGNACGCGGCCSGLWSWFHNGICGGQGCGDGACCSNTCAASGCDGSVCDGACGCCDRDHLYVSAEYLLWWTKGDRVPPLITQGSVGDLQNGLPAGALNLNDTVVLFGGDYNTGARSGGRLTAGWWFGDDHCLGIEGSGFFLSSASTNFSATSAGVPILARPFFDTRTGGTPNVEFVSLINAAGTPVLAGTAAASIRSNFYGAEANLRSNLCCSSCFNLDAIAGYRFAALNETLGVSENLTFPRIVATDPLRVGLSSFASNDNFRVRNNFNGGQIGLDAELRRDRWFLDLKAKIAFGDVTERADISGGTTQNGVFSNGGLLTADRTGSFSQHRFAVLPEVGLNLGYNLTEHVRAFVGYDFLYLSNVIRAGDQVNLNVNPNRFLGVAGGPANSPYAFHTSDYWAQGVNFGLEFRW